MTAQSPNESSRPGQRKSAGASRFIDVAVAAAALPAVVLSSVAAAPPAMAVQAQQAPSPRVLGVPRAPMPAATIVPAAMVAAQVPASSITAPRATPTPYTVEAGDTLGAIAAHHGVSLQSILTANKLTQDAIIHPGQKITVGTPSAAPGPVTSAAATVPANPVPATFLGYTYPDHVVADANATKALLESLPAPSPAEMKQIVADTARTMGVDPSLALAFAFQESSFDQRAVSPAHAIGAMQVVPSSGAWAGELVGRELNLLDPYDNATAGVAIIRSLIRTSPSLDIAVASYYQGQYSVTTHGMFSDTQQYVSAITSHQKNFR